MTTLPRVWTGARRALVAAAFVAALLGWGPAAGPAPADDESISSFDSVIDVDARGDLHVTETITYLFAGAEHHGLQRELPTRAARPGDTRDRLYPVSGVTASSPSGAPAQVLVSDVGGTTVIRIGDPLRTVTGRHTYVLHYTVAGAFTRRSTHDELAWNVTGTEWNVPIDQVSARVTAPGPATSAACSRGVAGSTDRCTAKAGPTSTFSAEGLTPREGVTVALTFSVGAVTAPGPVLADDPGIPHTAAEQPEAGPVGQAVGFALLLAVLAGLLLLVKLFHTWTVTDRPASSAPSSAPRPTPSAPPSELVSSAAGPSVPTPLPDDLRPGQLAVLRDRRAGSLAVTATLLDLAVRGYLKLKPIYGRSRFRAPNDWLLIRRRRCGDQQLLPYEDGLLTDTRGAVTISRMHRDHLAAARRRLVADAVERGWLVDDAEHAGPLSVKRVLRMLAPHRRLRRTPAGEALLAKVDRVHAELVARYADELFPGLDPATFSRWLPYLLVFGLADEWAIPIRRSAPSVDALRWYDGGPAGTGYANVCDGVTAFSTCIDHSSTVGSSGVGYSSGSGPSSAFGHSRGFGGFGGFGGSDHSGGGGGGGGGSSW